MLDNKIEDRALKGFEQIFMFPPVSFLAQRLLVIELFAWENWYGWLEAVKSSWYGEIEFSRKYLR